MFLQFSGFVCIVFILSSRCSWRYSPRRSQSACQFPREPELRPPLPSRYLGETIAWHVRPRRVGPRWGGSAWPLPARCDWDPARVVSDDTNEEQNSIRVVDTFNISGAHHVLPIRYTKTVCICWGGAGGAPHEDTKPECMYFRERATSPKVLYVSAHPHQINLRLKYIVIKNQMSFSYGLQPRDISTGDLHILSDVSRVANDPLNLSHVYIFIFT